VLSNIKFRLGGISLIDTPALCLKSELDLLLKLLADTEGLTDGGIFLLFFGEALGHSPHCFTPLSSARQLSSRWIKQPQLKQK
jgi:hypothetical protein